MEFFTPENTLALVTLTLLEIVLGIDNIIFVSIVVSKLEASKQHLARQLGLTLAMFMRIALLLAISWVMGLTKPLVSVLGHTVSWRDIILLLGGMFLIGKATHEIHTKLEFDDPGSDSTIQPTSYMSAIVQIILLDIVFSLDSVITAVGMVKAEGDTYWYGIGIMVTAIVIAVGVMLVFAEPVSQFVSRRPTVKMLALSFLILIGVMLVADSVGTHIEKGYIYFAMAFALIVEALNLQVRGRPEDRARSQLMR